MYLFFKATNVDLGKILGYCFEFLFGFIILINGKKYTTLNTVAKALILIKIWVSYLYVWQHAHNSKIISIKCKAYVDK